MKQRISPSRPNVTERSKRGRAVSEVGVEWSSESFNVPGLRRNRGEGGGRGTVVGSVKGE